MPIVLNDGSVPYGSAEITINAVSYIIEDSNGTTPVSTVDVPSIVGAPAKQVLVSGKKSGTMTLQLPNSGSAVPAPGDTFTMPAYFGGSDESFAAALTEVSTPRNVNDYMKVAVGWVEVLNP